MAGFTLHKGSGTRYLDVQHRYTDADQFDEVMLTVTDPGWNDINDAMTAFPRGDVSPGGNFTATEVNARWSDGGAVIAEVVYKGAFQRKYRVEHDLIAEAWSTTNVKIEPVDPDKYWARGEVLVSTPAVTVWLVDEHPPPTGLIGRPAFGSLWPGGPGLPFPTAPQNPFTELSEGTIHYPFGWVLLGCPSEQVFPGIGMWKKELRYVYRHKFTP